MTSRASSPSAVSVISATAEQKRAAKRTAKNHQPAPAKPPAAVPEGAPKSERETQSPEPEPVKRTSGSEEALTLLCGGMPDLIILRTLRERRKCLLSTAKKFLAEAYAELATMHAACTPEERLARSLLQRETIIAAAAANDDFKLTLTAIESRDKAYPPLEDTAPDHALTTLLDIANLARQGDNQTGSTNE